jgi:hypothetical protein
METPHAETVVDKAVAYVKEVLRIHPDTPLDVEAQPENHTAPATHLEPRAYGTRVGELDAGSFVRPLGNPEDERVRRAIDEQLHERMVKLNAENARAEEAKFDAFPTKSVAEVNDEIVRRENGM